VGQRSKYRIVSVLGQGGMGSVYRAEHLDLGRACALKLLKAGLIRNQQARKRFKREMRNQARLSHPNLVKVFDSGEQDGTAWFAMELVEGSTLARRMEALGRMSLSEALWVARELIEVLAYVHGCRLVHRDLKPSNVMLTDEGVLKLMDFGLALGEEQTRVTEENATVGTLLYCPPEIFEIGQESDHRSDLYQWGLVVWECLAGGPLVKGRTLSDIVASIRQIDAPSLRALRPDVPPALDGLLADCIRHSRADRLPRADQVRARLRPILSKIAASPGRLIPSGEDAPSFAAEEAAPVDGPRKSPEARRQGTRLALLAGVLAVAVALLAWTRGGAPKAPPRITGLTVGADRCTVWGTSSAGTRLFYELVSRGRPVGSSFLRPDGQGRFSFDLRGLEDGRTYRITVGQRGGASARRQA